MNPHSTIVAVATPPGRGGIGIVRISGSSSLAIAQQLVRTSGPWTPWAPVRAALLSAGGEPIDDVIVTFFAKPRSYTGEDVAEIACHGAPVVLRHCVERAVVLGALPAEPGEFSLRAFLNGRLDLPQAEAVRDLIEATTLHQARVAAQQIGGSLARRIKPLKAKLLEFIALLEAGIDFAEDDVSVASDSELMGRLEPIVSGLKQLAGSFAYGHVLREGFSLAIVGRPNVGKSSLFNRLLEQDRAIVTGIPGTTRDLVSEVAALDGIPIRLMDTAGIREGENVVESLGIERSYQAMADADLVLVVVDAIEGSTPDDRRLLETAASQGRYLQVVNKIDAGTAIPEEAIAVSAKTGEGIERLRSRIVESVAGPGAIDDGGAIVTNVRQERSLRESIEALEQARAAIEERVPHEMLLLDLYAALAAIDELTGKTTADDILNRIFSTFCIGK